jgi:trimethylamine--corrinoid protein Co-methyltransferase
MGLRVVRPLRVLSETDIERLDDAIMATLERVGVAFPLERARQILQDGGARVDDGTGVARLPRAVVRQALAAAPRRLLLAGRDPACDLVLDLEHGYLSNDASGTEVLDHRTGRRRPSTLADVADSARFVDGMPELAYYWGPIVAAGDTPLGSRPVHESAAVLAGTSKHYQAVTTVGERPTRLLVELAAAVVGGSAELRRRPIVSLIQCPVDPLGNDRVALEAGLVAAEHGIPCGFLSLTLGCGTAPATLAGNLVVNMAAVLADLVLLQLAYPGAPVFIGSAPSLMDLRTGGYTGGGPEDHLLAAACTQLAHHFGLPVAVGTMATGAKDAGWQAAVDDSLSTFASVMSGADMMNGAGLLNGSTILSYPHMVLESEILTTVAAMARRPVGDVDEAARAPEPARAAVAWPPGTDGGVTVPAAAAGERAASTGTRPAASGDHAASERADDALERATERAAGILARHRPQPLGEDVTAALVAICTRADAELGDA